MIFCRPSSDMPSNFENATLAASTASSTVAKTPSPSSARVDALGAGRYTVEHLGEGTVIDDRLAAWLARGWGGEVIFFDRTEAVGVSRPDLMSVGRLAQLPAAEAYAGYLLGRSDTVISHRPDWLAASGTVVVDGRRYLLQLFRSDPLRSGDGRNFSSTAQWQDCEGQSVTVLHLRGDWVQVRGSGHTGWIPADAIEVIGA